MTLPLLNIYEDFEPDYFVERKDPDTGVLVPANGITTFAMRISLTRNGTVVGACTTGLTERASTGIYAGTIGTAILVAGLATYLGRVVYIILSKSGNLDMRWDSYVVSDNAPVEP